MQHGQKKIERHSMNQGKQVSVKPVRFCRIHGLVGEFQWRAHELCGCGERGAGLEIPKLKAMRKAA